MSLRHVSIMRFLAGAAPGSCRLCPLILSLPFHHFGRMPEWTKGADCKSAIRGFESHSGLFELLLNFPFIPNRRDMG